jgi:two-component system phosphate regulon response regulator OmpR
MTNNITILVVDDEAELREMIEEYLSAQGFSVITAENGVIMRDVLTQHAVDLALLDIKMPGEDGLSLARYLREHYQMGIIMLTAAAEVIDRIIGLEIGADDYITKPFDPRELLARVKSVLRRLEAAPVSAPTASSDRDHAKVVVSDISQGVRFGHCILNMESHRLFDEDGQEVPITNMEFDLLKAFATNPNRVLSRDQLLDMAHNRDWDPFDRSIDIRIARIRRKIEDDPAKPQTIKTVRGAGYIFVPEPTSVDQALNPAS